MSLQTSGVVKHSFSSQVRSSESRSPVTLPVEVWERIIDCVVPSLPSSLCLIDMDRYRTLRACALTCRAWLSRSQYHIFHTVILDDVKTFLRFLRALHSNAKLQSVVHELVIAEDHNPGTWMVLLPHTLPSQLINLRRITFASQTAEALHPNFHVVLSQFSTVTAFSVLNSLFISIEDLTQLILAFPNLADLSLTSVGVVPESPGDESELPTIQLQRPSLQTLSIQSCNTPSSREIIRWVTETPTISSLVHLTFRPRGTAIPGILIENLGQLIRSCAATLETVHLTFGDTTAADEYKHLDLSHNKSLRVLELRKLAAGHVPQIARGILSTISSRQLDRLVLELVTPQDRFDAIEWKSLDGALAQVTFGALSTVSVRCHILCRHYPGSIDRVPFQRRMVSGLPALRARGVLRVSVKLRPFWSYD